MQLDFAYASHAAVWSLAGLSAGLVIGASLVINARSTGTEDVMPDELPTPAGRERRWWRVVRGNVVALALVLLAAGSAIQVVWATEADGRITECLKGYANGFADAIDARSAASAEAQEAVDALWQSVGKLTTSAASPDVRDQFQRSLAEYLSKREKAKQQQQENPYPPAPRDLCK